MDMLCGSCTRRGRVKGDFNATVKTVHLDAHAAFKIVKFSRGSKLGLSGALLGLEKEGILGISNCYPLPKLSLPQHQYKEDYEIAAEIEKQREVGKKLMELMQLICEDSTTVGWYQSSPMGDYINDATLQNQYQLQTQSPNCVCIIFDVSMADQALKAFKAIRLTSYAMRTLSVLSEGSTSVRLTDQDLLKAGMKLEAMFEEVPIVIQRPHLLQQYLKQEFALHDLHMNSEVLKISPEQHAISRMYAYSIYVLRMSLNGYLSDFMQEQAKLYENKKRMRASKGKDEAEVDTTAFYLMGNQIMSSCHELHDFRPGECGLGEGMSLTAAKQQLMTKLTGIDKASIQ